VVLDIMMPGEDGLWLCRHLRANTQLPVIMLTAMAEDTDRVIGLEMGADDYLTKPFNPRELVARIKAVLRRGNSMPRQRVQLEVSRVRFDRWTLEKGAARADQRGRRGGAAEYRGVPAAQRLPQPFHAWCSAATTGKIEQLVAAERPRRWRSTA
jgi:DNA-binding response OmpR family regulator